MNVWLGNRTDVIPYELFIYATTYTEISLYIDTVPYTFLLTSYGYCIR